jgi:putative hydrolase of the HAD superfamily
MLFIFDMDDVLFQYDWRTRMSGLTALTGKDMMALRTSWWHDEGEWAAEAGAYATADDYLGAFTAAVDTHITPEQWLDNRRSGMIVDRAALAAVARASELGEVTLLTNNNPMVAENLPQLAPELVPLFGDNLHASCEYGARKPDPEVFRRVLASFDTDASDAFFADDMAINVAAAASIGITSHQVTRATGAAGMLAAIEAFAASRVSV